MAFFTKAIRKISEIKGNLKNKYDEKQEQMMKESMKKLPSIMEQDHYLLKQIQKSSGFNKSLIRDGIKNIEEGIEIVKKYRDNLKKEAAENFLGNMEESLCIWLLLKLDEDTRMIFKARDRKMIILNAISEVRDMEEYKFNKFVLTKLHRHYMELGMHKESFEINQLLQNLKEASSEQSPEDEEGSSENIKHDFNENVEKGKTVKTKNDLKVQSQGEKLIAEFLDDCKIGYDYDEQITLKGNEKNKRGHDTSWCRPDFYLTEFHIIIEYWGLKGTKDYDKHSEEKKRLYKEANQRFISITPSDLSNIEEILTKKLKLMGINI